MDPLLEEEILPHLDPDEEVEAMMRLYDPYRVPENVRVICRFGDVITCRIRRGDIREVYKSPLKKSLKASRQVSFDYPETNNQFPDNSTRYFDTPDLKAPSGKGVVVAILDWGFDFAHPNFRNKDGTTRLLALWDQTVRQKDFEPYGYGQLHTEAAINRALISDTPYQTLGYHPAKSDGIGIGAHGTHVADLAAGNATVGNQTWPASDVKIIFVHMATKNSTGLANLGDATRILEALDFAGRVAGDRPLVVNVSMGKHGGSHDGLSLVEIGMDNFLKDRTDTMICQSTGNYYQANAHSMGLVRPGKARDFSFFVNRADKTPNEVEIWYSGKDEFVMSLIHQESGRVYRSRIRRKSVLRDENDEIIGRIYHRSNEPNNGKNHINLFLYNNAPSGNWKIKLHGEKIVDGRYHAWVERDRDCRGCKAMFSPRDSNNYYTNGSICNGFNTIVVGAYNATGQQPEIAPFSSQGPTTDGRHKPDIIAPGVSIIAAKSTPRHINNPTRELTGMSGTSMATPQVTKTVALLLEILPRGTPFWVIRNLIVGTADEFKKPSIRNGSGRLQIPAAIEAAKKQTLGLAWTETHRSNKDQSIQFKAQNIMRFNDQTGEFIEEDFQTGEFINDNVLTETRRAVGTFKLLPNSNLPNRVYIEDSSPQFTHASFDEALQFALQRSTEAHSVITGNLYNGGNYVVYDYRKMVSFITRPVIISNLNDDVCCLVLNARDVYFPENPLNRTTRWVIMPRMREYYALAQADQNRHRNRWIGRIIGVRQHITVTGQTVNNTYLRGLSAPALRLLLANFSTHTYQVGTVRRRDSSGVLRDKGGIVNGVTKPLFTYPLREPECYFSVTSQAEGAMESINAWDYKAGISIGPIQFNAQRGAILKWLYILFTRDRALFDRELGNHYRWSLRLQGNNPVLTVNHGTPAAFDLRGTNNAEVRRTYGYFQSGDPNRHRWAEIVPDFRRTMAGRFAKVLAWPHVQEMVLEVSSWWAQAGMTTIRNSGLADLNTTNPDRDAFILKSLLISTYVRFSGCLQPLINGLNTYTSVSAKLSNWESALNTTSATCKGLRDRLRSQVNHADAIHGAIQRVRTQIATSTNNAGNSNSDLVNFPDHQISSPAWEISDFEVSEGLSVNDAEVPSHTACSCGDTNDEMLDQPGHSGNPELEDFSGSQGFSDLNHLEQINDFIDQGLSFEHFLENMLYEKAAMFTQEDGAFKLSGLFDSWDLSEIEANKDIVTVVNRPGEAISNDIRMGDILLQRSETGEVFASVITDPTPIEGSQAGNNTDTLIPYKTGRYLNVTATGIFPKRAADNYAKMISEEGAVLLYDQMIIRPLFNESHHV